MSTRLLFAFVLAFAAVVRASDNSVEVTLEDAPEHQQAPQTSLRWKFRPGAAIRDSDSEGGKWRYKFYAGSDKPLGTAADAAAIKRLVPSTMPVAIRWISRSVVVVAADCYSDISLSAHVRCLYVLEKHRSKWKVTHHYAHGLPAIVRPN